VSKNFLPIATSTIKNIVGLYMNISTVTSAYSSGMHALFPSQERAAGKDGALASSDTVQISSEAQDLFATAKHEQEALEKARATEVGTKVSAYWDNQDVLSEGHQYSEWLPENYEKYTSMMEEAKLSGDPKSAIKIGMVFDTLGADKLIADTDIEEGVAALGDEQMMKSFVRIPTIEEGFAAIENETFVADAKLNKWKTQRYV